MEDNDQFDLNKLAGLSFGRSHHTNSARVCWCYNSETQLIELFSYIYNNKKREFKHITNCNIDSDCMASIVVNDETVDFKINGVPITCAKSKWPNWGYRLFPYFGGDKVAPHDINVWLSMNTN